MKQQVREVIQCYRAGRSMNESENATRRISYDKFSNEERDCHRRLWWYRKLDRETTGERWIFGGRELRGKTGPGTSSCRRSQGRRRTGHRCASRCGKCRRRG